MPSTKKVILFLVEGPSDETALGSPFKKLLEAEGLVETEAFHCDVTVARMFRGRAPIKVEKDVRETVRKFVLRYVERKSGYTVKDLARIIHVVDLDGVFVPDDAVVEASVEGIVYETDHIKADNTAFVRRRNAEKAQALRALMRKGILTFNKHSVSYGLYFVSRNLEHALYGIERECTDGEKRSYAYAFRKKYVADMAAFVALLKSDAVRVPGDTSNETWVYAQEGVHSLERGSNLHLLVPEDDDPQGLSSEDAAARNHDEQESGAKAS